MKRTPTPNRLLSLRKLEGGQYGTLDVASRPHNRVELSLGGDFVFLDKGQWIAVRRAVDKHYGFIDTITETDRVITTTDAHGNKVVVEEHDESINNESVVDRRRRGS